MKKEFIPDNVIGRLPGYLRTLQYMEKEGVEVISSKELSEKIGYTAALIRKDLSHFGEFGKQGTGYNIPYLIEQLQSILNLHQTWEIAIIGAGDIGHAFARYNGFTNRGFVVKMIFDNDPAKIGKSIGDLEILDSKKMVETIRAAGIKIALLAIPASAAQGVAEELVTAGIKAVLCYSPVLLSLPADIQIQYIDTILNFQHMTYYLK